MGATDSVIDIGRFAQIPFSILTYKISPRAKVLWALLTLHASAEKCEVLVRQAHLAEYLHCSTSSVARALKELMHEGMIMENKARHQSKCKIYRLALQPQKQENASAVVSQQSAQQPSQKSPADSVASDPSTTNALPSEQPSPTDSKQNFPSTGAGAEEAWITKLIRLNLDKSRKRDQEELDGELLRARQHGFSPKRTELPKEEPICEKNYPLQWGFLRIKWGERKQRSAA